MDGMPLAMASEATSSTVGYQTSHLLIFPLQMCKDFSQARQTSALSFHFYYHCLEGTLGFHKTCILLPVASSLLPFLHDGSSTCASSVSHLGPKLFLQNTSSMAERDSTVEPTASIRTLSTREPGRAQARLREEEVCAVGSAELPSLLWSSEHRENVC